MISDIYSNIRSINGSKHDAFEKLICSLAREYTPSNQKNANFVTNGNPDGGVECYWVLDDKSEWGWQAKFFDKLDTTQITQVKNSFRNAIKTHPSITKYIVCVPIGLPDPRKQGKTSARKKWNTVVENMKKEANGLEVEIILWDQQKISDKIMDHSNQRGIYYYYFNKEIFSIDWLKSKNQTSLKICNDSGRYTPELNIDLSITKYIDAVFNEGEFRNSIKNLVRAVRKIQINNLIDDESQQKEFREKINSITSKLECYKTNDKVEFAKIKSLSSEVKALLPSYNDHTLNPSQENDRDRIYTHLNKLYDFCDDNRYGVYNHPYALITGDPGSGKTHCLAHIVSQAQESDQPALLLLGNQFTGNKPVWENIRSILGLNDCDQEGMLGAMSELAKAKGRKFLLVIDALNEISSSLRRDKFWENHLSNFIESVKQHKNIALIISIRSDLKSLLADETREDLIEIKHYGFSDQQAQAQKKYFGYYNIKTPSVPLLNPESSNPLMLKLICEGIRNTEGREITQHSLSLANIYKNYIAILDKKFRGELISCGINRNTKPVSWIKNLICEMMANSRSKIINRSDLEDSVKMKRHEHLLDNNLIDFLLEERFLCNHCFEEEQLFFSFDRSADYLITEYIVREHFEPNNPVSIFKKEKAFSGFSRDDGLYSFYIEEYLMPLSIILAEKHEIEIFELLDENQIDVNFNQAFISGLKWRDKNSITEKTIDYVKRLLKPYSYEVFDLLASLSATPDHPLNAITMHQILFNIPINERDLLLGHYTYNNYTEDYNSIDNIINWSLDLEYSQNLNEESRYLCSIFLTWLLASSYRKTRDKATKALVTLYENQPLKQLLRILKLFEDIDDLYIQERLYCATYGVVLRSNNNENIKIISQYVYDSFFGNGNIPMHVLLRDYARGIVEVAIDRGIEISNYNQSKVLPPYNSYIDFDEIPSIEEIKNKLEEKVTDQESLASKALYRFNHSMSDILGDFNRYIIEFSVSHWTQISRESQYQKSNKELKEEFIENLTKDQSKLYSNLPTIEWSFDEKSFSLQGEKNELEETEYKTDFINSLTKAQKDFLEDNNIDPFDHYKDHECFDSKIAKQWMYNRVIELGWCSEKFASFDGSDFVQWGRHSPTDIERIAKKYQRVAYHEFLGYLADNYYLKKDELYDDISENYHGPWQIRGIRDIDPSQLVIKTEGNKNKKIKPCWWSSEFKAVQAHKNSEYKKWIASEDDIVNLETSIKKKYAENNWYVLHSYSCFDTLGSNHNKNKLETFYFLGAFFVNEAKHDNVLKWVKKHNSYKYRIQAIRNCDLYSDIFIGEYCHNASFKDSNKWKSGNVIYDQKDLNIANYKFSSFEDDKSYLQERSSYKIPISFIIKSLKLKWNGFDGFNNEKGEKVIYDPYIYSSGPSVLVIREDALSIFLNKEKLSIFWLVWGEKTLFEKTILPEATKRQDFCNYAYSKSNLKVHYGKKTIYNPDNSMSK